MAMKAKPSNIDDLSKTAEALAELFNASRCLLSVDDSISSRSSRPTSEDYEAAYSDDSLDDHPNWSWVHLLRAQRDSWESFWRSFDCVQTAIDQGLPMMKAAMDDDKRPAVLRWSARLLMAVDAMKDGLPVSPGRGASHWDRLPHGWNNQLDVLPRFIRELEAASMVSADDPPAPAARGLPPLDDIDIAVLLDLLDHDPVLRVQVDVEAYTGVGRKAVAASMTSLIDAGYSHRPKGERSGTGLTDKGRKVALKIKSKKPMRDNAY